MLQATSLKLFNLFVDLVKGVESSEYLPDCTDLDLEIRRNILIEYIDSMYMDGIMIIYGDLNVLF